MKQKKGKGMTHDLASGFQSVDRASEFALFSGCLDLIDSLPFSLSASARVMTCLAPLPGAEFWRSVVTRQDVINGMKYPWI